MPDTDDADGLAERYWPEEYKGVIKTNLRQAVEDALLREKPFGDIYQKVFSDRFDCYETFLRRLAELVEIGSENGADDILEEIHGAIRRNHPLPDQRQYAVYFWPEPFDETLKTNLHREVFEEFGTHHTYRHIYEDHLETQGSFDEFVDHLARLVVNGAVNGADKALGDIFQALLFETALPNIRRRPKRVR